MRPLQLVISGFGPYAKEVQIPFSKFGTQGIYLITGDTGAGKTTVFDAITFALYGEASTDVRKAGMLRSDFADPETKSYVDFLFSYKEQEYRILRNPEYERPKLHKEGITKEVAGASLWLPDGHLITGMKRVTEYVEELLSLNRNQFVQTAMLAQGEFQKMLFSGTKERSEIFRQLFHTENYQNFQSTLKKRAQELYGEYADKKKSMEQYISGIQKTEEWPLFSVEKGDEAYHIEEIYDALCAMTDRDKQEEKESKKQLKLIEKQLHEIGILLGRSMKKEEDREKLKQQEKQLKELLPKLEEVKERMGQTSLTEETLEKKRIELQKKQEVLQLYEQLEQQEQLLKLQQKEYEKIQKKMLQQEKESLMQRKKIEKAELFLESCGELEKDGYELDRLWEKCTQKQSSLQKWMQELEKLLLIQKEYEVLAAAYSSSQAEQQILNARYASMEQHFYDAQAGILAKRLKMSEPCPVCGATEHPMPAKLADKVPDKEELAQALKEVRSHQELVQQNSQLAGAKKGQLETLQKQVCEDFSALSGRRCKHEDDMITKASKLEEAFKKEWERITIKKSRYEQKVEKRKQVKQELIQAKEAFEACTKEYQLMKEESVRYRTVLQTGQERVRQHKNELPEITKTVFARELKKQQKQFEQEKEAFACMKSRYEELEAQTVFLKGSVSALKEALRDAKEDCIPVLQEEKARLEKRRQEVLDKSRDIHTRLQVNESIAEKMKKGKNELETLEKNYASVVNLSRTANGEITGRPKITFENYIQRVFFQQMIQEANKRFLTMTDGRFVLKRRTEADNLRSQAGLELDVLDYYTGKVRSVKTLSGGEAFKASLALAFGMADIISAYAGGVQLDTVFVDEGFGSLDEESLEQAMEILEGLTDNRRLVGIISHVSELKERIDHKIIVKKGIHGSYLEFTI